MGNKTTIESFLGNVTYENYGQDIWGKTEDNNNLLLNVRGWGTIQHLFETPEEAANFQDELGQFYVDAINEKLERLKNKK